MHMVRKLAYIRRTDLKYFLLHLRVFVCMTLSRLVCVLCSHFLRTAFFVEVVGLHCRAPSLSLIHAVPTLIWTGLTKVRRISKCFVRCRLHIRGCIITHAVYPTIITWECKRHLFPVDHAPFTRYYCLKTQKNK